MMQDILVFLNRERQKSGFKPPRARESQTRMDVGNLRGAGTGRHLSKAPHPFQQTPPRGLMNSLLSSPLIFFIRRTGRKENQNRVRTPGQEKRMELEELELEPTPTSLRCAEIGRPGIASLPIPGAWADLAKGTPGN